jgi:hypothetical protein
MTERVLGPTGSPRRRWTLLLPLVAVLALGLFYVAGAQATHDDNAAAGVTPYLFELDRNANDSPAGGADDWDTQPRPTGEAAVFTGILGDIAAPGDQFQGGGSKDDLDISQWLYKAGEPLDKDDITNAYAAGYVNTVDTGFNDVGHFIVYFGLDRFSNDGSAQVGFWFFKNQILKTNDAAGGGFKFSGVHAVGDVLVQSNFTNGGVVDNISVFKWVGSGGSNGSLDLLFSAPDCVGPPAAAFDDPACATVNRGDTPAPWSYTPKSGTAGTFPQGSFFEGGINLTRLVPDIGCVSSFLAETRSSTPFDSRLKDLRLGDFNTCRAVVSTTSSTTASNVVPGTSVTDSVTVTGTSLTGGSAPTPQGTVKFVLCQPADVTAGGCVAPAGSQVGAIKTLNASGQATSDATTNTTALGKYCWRAEYTPAAGSPYSATSHTNATTECFTTVAQPTAMTTRQWVVPQDKVVITASSGGNLAGNARFTLHDSLAECQSRTDAKYDSGNIAIAGASPQPASTSNTYRILDGTTHYWNVSYTSTNLGQLDSSSVCTETTAVTFAGNDTNISIP